MQFMNCTTCQRIVQINNTGICLGCQRGFTGIDAEDVYKPPSLKADCKQDISATHAEDTEIERLETRQKEIEDALEEISQQESSVGKHQDGDGIGKASKASRRDSLKRRQKS